MKKTNLSKKIVLIAAALMLITTPAWANEYPPDNAAVLYYKAFMLYKPDKTMDDMLSDYVRDKIEQNEKIIEFLNEGKNVRIIQTLTDASQIEKCNWGLNFDEGFEMEMPYLSSLRNLSYLVLADAKLLAEQGNYKAALSQCIAVKKIAIHAGDDTLVSFLVSVAINALANGAIENILNSNIDTSTLNWLREQLLFIQKTQPQVKDALTNDLSIALNWKEQAIKEVPVESFSDDPKDQQKFREIINNDELLDKNIEYFRQHMNLTVQAFSLPYPKGYEQLKKIGNIPSEDAKSNPEAYFAAVFFPAVSRVYTLNLRAKADEFALNCAVALFIENAKNRRLPDSLPPNLPNDPFGNESFIYEKTAKGFTLKCDENKLPPEEKEHLDKYQYEFSL